MIYRMLSLLALDDVTQNTCYKIIFIRPMVCRGVSFLFHSFIPHSQRVIPTPSKTTDCNTSSHKKLFLLKTEYQNYSSKTFLEGFWHTFTKHIILCRKASISSIFTLFVISYILQHQGKPHSFDLGQYPIPLQEKEWCVLFLFKLFFRNKNCSLLHTAH